VSAFVQIVEVETSDIGAVNDLLKRWHDDQAGIAPGYRGTRVLADRDRANTYLLEVEFSSEEEAARNNDRAETQRWASALREAIHGEPRYLNLTESFATGR
jgi:hypothetical protein